jgi:hypothetical protein
MTGAPPANSPTEPTPTAWLFRPVSSTARGGEHSAVTRNRLYRNYPRVVRRVDRPAERARVAEASITDQCQQHIRGPLRKLRMPDQVPVRLRPCQRPTFYSPPHGGLRIGSFVRSGSLIPSPLPAPHLPAPGSRCTHATMSGTGPDNEHIHDHHNDPPAGARPSSPGADGPARWPTCHRRHPGDTWPTESGQRANTATPWKASDRQRPTHTAGLRR